MCRAGVGAVIVMSPIKEAIGIFTERDLMKRVIHKGQDLSKPIKEFMTPDFQCVQLDDDLAVMPKIMLDNHFRHLPVVDGHDVVGMLSIRDVMCYLIND